MKYYKIVTPKLESAVIQGKNMVQYKINEWVEPNKGYGPLFVYNNLEIAYAFWGDSKFFKFYECEVDTNIDKYKDKIFKLKELECEGVILVSKVKLVRKIENERN